MNILRAIGYVGLIMLTAVVVLSMYLSFTSGNHKGLFVGAAAIVVFAFIANILWVKGRQQQVPFASVVPNRTLFAGFYLVLGIGALAAGIERAIAGAWLSALIGLCVSLLLLGTVYRALLGRTQSVVPAATLGRNWAPAL